GLLRICRLLTGQNLVPQHFSLSHYRSEAIPEMIRFVGTKVEFGADRDEFALNLDARELPLIHADPYLNDLLLKSCETALADRRSDTSELRTKVENAISLCGASWRFATSMTASCMYPRSRGCSAFMRWAHSRTRSSDGPEKHRGGCEQPALIE